MPPRPCRAETRASTFSPPWTWLLSRAFSSWAASSGKRSGASSSTKARSSLLVRKRGRHQRMPPPMLSMSGEGLTRACFASVERRSGSWPQIDVSRRLQLRDAHDAPFLGHDESQRQVLQRDVLRLHGVAAGIERRRRLRELAEAAHDLGVRRDRVERLERRTVYDQRDGHLVGTSGTLEMVADIAEHETDLVEVGEVIDDLRFLGVGGFGAHRARGGCKQRARRGERPREQVASMHGLLHSSGARTAWPCHLRRMAASSWRSVTSDRHLSRLARSRRNTRSSAPPLSGKPSSSGLLLRQMRMESSLIRVDLSFLASSTVMPPPGSCGGRAAAAGRSMRQGIAVPGRRRLPRLLYSCVSATARARW